MQAKNDSRQVPTAFLLLFPGCSSFFIGGFLTFVRRKVCQSCSSGVSWVRNNSLHANKSVSDVLTKTKTCCMPLVKYAAEKNACYRTSLIFAVRPDLRETSCIYLSIFQSYRKIKIFYLVTDICDASAKKCFSQYDPCFKKRLHFERSLISLAQVHY